MSANEFVFDSIGSRFWLERLDNKPFDNALKTVIINYANTFDSLYSRFKDDSLVAKLAQNGVINNPPAELLAMLKYSKTMYLASNGAFNITVGATLHKLGYGSRAHGGNLIADPWQQITWSATKVTAPKGLMLDFGGFGKGWMIDKISEILRQHGVTQFIVNGGGDLYVQSDAPIEIALENPLKPGSKLHSIELTHGALAGSDTIKRAWNDGQTLKHHIIDPRQGDSSNSGVVASYVQASTALVADTLATIVIIAPELTQKLQTKFNAQIALITS